VRTKKPLTATEAWSFLPVLLIFYAEEYHLVSNMVPWLAPWLSLAFAGFLIVMYLLAKNLFSGGLNSQAVTLAFVTVVFFHSLYLEILTDDLRPWLAVFVLAALSFVPKSRIPRDLDFENPFMFPALAAFVVFIMEYALVVRGFINGHAGHSVFAAGIALAMGLWAVVVKMPESGEDESNQGNILLYAAHIISIAGLYRITTDIGSLAVSAAWLLYAVGIMVFSFSRSDKNMAKSALFVLGSAAAKVLLYDVSEAPAIVRIWCLLLTGAVLYGCGFAMRRVARWNARG